LARNHDGFVFLKPKQAEELLGRLDISYYKCDMIEVFNRTFRTSGL
jgi:hypothetical protein